MTHIESVFFLNKKKEEENNKFKYQNQLTVQIDVCMCMWFFMKLFVQLAGMPWHTNSRFNK